MLKNTKFIRVCSVAGAAVSMTIMVEYDSSEIPRDLLRSSSYPLTTPPGASMSFLGTLHEQLMEMELAFKSSIEELMNRSRSITTT